VQQQWQEAAMSESAWQVRPQIPPAFRPQLLIGAASPLWGYFTGAAVAGMTWWWMTSWMRPAGPKPAPALPVRLMGAVEGPVGEALASGDLPALPVGGEAAPFGPAVLEAELLSPEPEPESQPELEPEPAIERPPAIVAEPASAKAVRAPGPRKPRGEPETKPH
jgi:hypothetical protein